jgi:hypothetical protein
MGDSVIAFSMTVVDVFKRQSLTELRSAVRNSRTEAGATWSHPDSSWPVTKFRNNGIKKGDHESEIVDVQQLRNISVCTSIPGMPASVIPGLLSCIP